MNKKIKLLLIRISLLTFNTCDKDDDASPKPQNTSINKILALGASRVEG